MQGFHLSITSTQQRGRLRALLRPLLILPVLIMLALCSMNTHDLQDYIKQPQAAVHNNTSQTTTHTVHHASIDMHLHTDQGWTTWQRHLFSLYLMTTIIIATAVAAMGALSCSALAFFLILFRNKYPAWLYQWNLHTTAWGVRIAAFTLLATDTYPDVEQAGGIALTLPNPNQQNLSRWMVLIKWLLALPHYIVLTCLWFVLIFTTPLMTLWVLVRGSCPTFWCKLTEGVLRYNTRVRAYVSLMLSDHYPEFALSGKKDQI